MIYKKEIKKVVEQIKKNYKPEKIILFGSYAWGKPTPDSDVDLFVIKKDRQPRIERERKLRKSLFGLGVPVDVLVYTPQEIQKRLDFGDFFIEDIIKNGKTIYSL